MEFTDKNLVCIDCQRSFVWTAGEQLFYHESDFRNEPKLCKECKARRSSRGGQASRQRPETTTVCSSLHAASPGRTEAGIRLVYPGLHELRVGALPGRDRAGRACNSPRR